MRWLTERRLSRLDLVLVVLGAIVIQRLLVTACAKAAAFYAARGDERQAARFSRLARHFARMSHMFGELEEETEGSR